MQARTGQLHSASVDSVFVLGIPLVAILLGTLTLARPATVVWVLAFDLWCVSFPHVASTFTRIAFTARDARRHRLLLVVLPFAALALAASITRFGGLVALNTTYFLWQSFHYTRQSYGIDRAYRAAAGSASRNDPLATAIVYLVPLWGVLVRCAEGTTSFLAVSIALPRVPMMAAHVVGGLAACATIVWVGRTLRIVTSDDGERETHRALYLLTHVAIFTFGYVVVRDLTRGWLVVNVWHNAQYLVFVWMQNRRRFDAGEVHVDDALLAAMSRPASALRYFVTCAALGTLSYGAIYLVTGMFGTRPAVAWFLVAMQTVNFHHYVVDALIWRRPPRQAASGRTVSWASAMNRN